MDLPKGALLLLGDNGPAHGDQIKHVAISPSGALVASTANDRRWRLWDAATGALLVDDEAEPSVAGLCFLDDESALGATWDEGLVRWRWRDGDPEPLPGPWVARFDRNGPMMSRLAHAAGRFVVSHRGWIDPTTATPVRVYTAPPPGAVVWGEQEIPPDCAEGLAITPDGRRLIALSTDDRREISCFDLETGLLLWRRPWGHYVQAHFADMRVSPSGRYAAITHGDARVIEVETGQEIAAHLTRDPQTGLSLLPEANGFDGAAFVDDDTLLVTNRRRVRLWGWRDDRVVAESEFVTPALVLDIAVRGDLAVMTDEDTVTFWRLPTLERLHAGIGHRLAVSSLAWSADMSRLTSRDAEREIVWDLADGAIVSDRPIAGPPLQRLQVPPDFQHLRPPPTALVTSPDGALIAAGVHRGVSLYKTGGKKPKRWKTLTGHRHAVTAIAWSPDAKRLASGEADGRIVVWKARR